MSDEKKYKYIYPTDELDSIIKQIDQGITPMMNDQLQLEVKLRYKELREELFDEDDDEDEDIVRHRKMMSTHIEQKRREASRNDIIYIELSDEQRQKLREEMRVSMVRDDPNDVYHKSDEELYSSEEKRIIEQKLSRLKNCYYNQVDYVNAMNIIREAISFSLKNDYPWLSYDEAVEEFNKGNIKFTYCNLPKLYINYQTQITDRDILKGILTGKVTLKDKSEEKPKKKKTNKNTETVSVDYNIIGENEFNHYARLHSMGYDTPVSTIIKSKSTVYNRFSLPSTNRFSINNNNNKNDEDNLLFDWTQEGAGLKYFNNKYNKKYQVSDLMRDVNEDNDNMLSHVLNSNANSFLNSMKHVNNPNYDGRVELYSTSLEVDPKTVQIEQNILNAIRMSNANRIR